MTEKSILNKIKSPADLKNLSLEKLDLLCEQIREKLIHVVSENGGHLASNLGAVELTVALHTVFDAPEDSIIWDVGHQSYTHKMLTGRLDKIDTIRQEGGLSGFPKRSESIYDPFNAGHSSTSISAAFGLANAKSISGQNGKIISVIGDGALTGGLAYEGLNNAGRFKKNFIVILNDNKMSISKNVGSIARCLAYMRVRPIYIKAKGKIGSTLTHIPLIGKFIKKALVTSKSLIKNALYKSTIFENMGFLYYGPVDGHDMKSLIDVLTLAKDMDKPVLIHVITTKGKGYEFAEKNPKMFHGISKFDITTGHQADSKISFSDVFGQHLCDLAEGDNRICAITAAMKLGTGLLKFSRSYRNRFFDVGIAEEHAITFAGGMAAGGMLPIFAVYSSFLQRGYDQIIHDAASQNLKVTLAIDRAGIVGEDGETHQGVFDTAFLNSIPNVTIYAPSFFDELKIMMDCALYKCPGVSAIRYPRGGEIYKPDDFTCTDNPFNVYGDVNSEIAIVTYGRLFSFACIAKDELAKQGKSVCIIKLNRIKPIEDVAVNTAKRFKYVFFFEEGIQCGGIGEHFNFCLCKRRFKGEFILKAIDDRFVTHASVNSSLHSLGLDSEGMINTIITECAK